MGERVAPPFYNEAMEEENILHDNATDYNFLIAGTYGNVYSIMSCGKPYAIKQLKKDKYINLLYDEYVITRLFNHPNIIKFHEFSYNSSSIIMDLAKADLFEYTKKIVNPIEALDKYYPQMLAAVSEVHRNGYLHMDIKLENFLVTDADKVLLCDFGLAELLQSKPAKSLKGTIAYASPMMLNGEALLASHDLWALGICVYILLTGNDPWPAGSKEATIELIKSCKKLKFAKELYLDKGYKKYIDIINNLCFGQSNHTGINSLGAGNDLVAK
jgi:serine/threonine protein kinase